MPKCAAWSILAESSDGSDLYSTDWYNGSNKIKVGLFVANFDCKFAVISIDQITHHYHYNGDAVTRRVN